MTATVVKLAFAGIRTRLLASVITVLLAATATSTIVLAFEVGASARDPWQRTFDAANGAHVLADVPTEADARDIAARPGVAEADEPTPITTAQARLPAGTEALLIVGLDSRPTVNVPIAVDGAHDPGAGIVLEHSLADAVGITVGDTLRLQAPSGPVDLNVVGTAISPSVSRYPRQNPGLAWVSRSTLEAVQPDSSQWNWLAPIRLVDPTLERAFADDVFRSFPPRTVYTITAGEQRENTLIETQPTSLILTTYTIVILLVVFTVIGILIGARASQQRREIGLAKAVGLTPRQVSTIFTIETTTLGVVGLLIGFAVGVLAAPRLAQPTFATLLGTPTIAPNPIHLVVAAIPILLVLAIGAWVSTRRRSRLSVVGAIRSGAGRPGSRSRIARLADRAGASLPLALGLKDLLAQRGRAALLSAAIAATTGSVVFALCMKATLDAPASNVVSDVPAELPALVYTLDGVLLVIAVTTLVAVTILAVREHVRDFGVLRTVGFTPRQVTSSLVSAHTAVAVVAATASIPLGIGLYIGMYGAAGGDSSDLVIAPWWWLGLVPTAAAVIVSVSTGLPARIAARTPIIDALRYE